MATNDAAASLYSFNSRKKKPEIKSFSMVDKERQKQMVGSNSMANMANKKRTRRKEIMRALKSGFN